MGYIVYVTDKHKGPQPEMTYAELQEELRKSPFCLFQGEIPASVASQFTQKSEHEISDKIIRIEPSDEAIVEEQNRLKEIISNQQKHIMRLERLLHEKGVSGEEISALPKE